MIGAGIKRGTAELAVLSILEEGPLHGYEMARRIEEQTKGALRFTLAALYPMLYRMEQRRWIRGSWETSDNGRRRRCYRLTLGDAPSRRQPSTNCNSPDSGPTIRLRKDYSHWQELLHSCRSGRPNIFGATVLAGNPKGQINDLPH